MRSLEGAKVDSSSGSIGQAGGKKQQRDVLSVISRPAPEPPRPTSMDSVQSASSVATTIRSVGSKEERKVERRKSLGLQKSLADLKEEAEDKSECPRY